MGIAKRLAIEENSREFYNTPNKFVCYRCVPDDFLSSHIKNNATNKTCSYCKKKSTQNISVSFDVFIECVLSGLLSEYADPNNEGVPWDEGDWVGTDVFDTHDLLEDHIDFRPENDSLWFDITHALSDKQWCERNWQLLSPDNIVYYGWERFKETVKFHTRYVFLQTPEHKLSKDFDFLPVGDFLDFFGHIILSLDLFKTIPINTKIYRMRVHIENNNLTTAKQLGSPPAECCTYANRMSPAGISMFYGAFNEEVCISETYDSTGDNHTGTFGVFTNTRPLLVIDFTKIPYRPSIFDCSPKNKKIRKYAPFIWKFLRDFSEKVEKDGREHIDYVPTQIVSEYIRRILKLNDSSFDGILYKSSRNTSPNNTACVLFFENSQCGNKKEGTPIVLTKVYRRSLNV